MNALRLAGVIKESIVDGPGLRYVVFAQGCPRRCKGCHNEETWSFEGGFESAPSVIVDDMKRNPLLKGVTLSGGEPFSQSGAFAELARLTRAAGYDVYTYTGYLYEDLLRLSAADRGVRALLRYTDTLIDGPFISERMSYGLTFRGSDNQRVIGLRGGVEPKRKDVIYEYKISNGRESAAPRKASCVQTSD
ncbi:MAG: anaerobic ribonucleoside-triphosphate reductase activating protein [Clostridiales bacterium]|jgi:anaerobic ribonucleoside-triphosphate reductase activating protein|nr:anaerobic ribonucleoside-triphosphate reductase activating protein [Clostridiales bacterium]